MYCTARNYVADISSLVPEPSEDLERTATRLVQARTQRTKQDFRIPENPIN